MLKSNPSSSTALRYIHKLCLTCYVLCLKVKNQISEYLDLRFLPVVIFMRIWPPSPIPSQLMSVYYHATSYLCDLKLKPGVLIIS